jgi:D-alanyl-D-alanine carboxypeptidase (penicillin-binding protein 5/6)
MRENMKKTVLLIASLCLFPLTVFGQAAVPGIQIVNPNQTQTIAPVETAAKQAFLMDSATGAALYEKDADVAMPTSSMSKMMTMYMVFDALKTGKLKMDDMMPVSEHAWKIGGQGRGDSSTMFLDVNSKVKVEDAIRGVIIQSGNDAAVVFAEALGGSEGAFADLMNAKAAQLGMTHSHFVNASGMPDPQHYSTARDLAILARHLIQDFPEDYHYFSETSFTYNGHPQGNRNPLLYRNMNVDGLKTGHTDIGGYGLTASAMRDGRRLILVLNGMKDMQMRADESAKLLDWGFREYGTYPVVKTDEKLADAKVWLGEAQKVPLLASRDVTLTLPKFARASLKTAVAFDQPVEAPVAKGQKLGTLTITAAGVDAIEVPLVAGNDVPKLGFFAQLSAKLHLLWHKV